MTKVHSCALALNDPAIPEGWREVKLNLDDNDGLGHWKVQGKACPSCSKPLVLAPRDSHERHKPTYKTEGEVWISPARCFVC